MGRGGERAAAPLRRSFLLASLVLLIASRLEGTSIIPIRDSELYLRADIVVHGIVLSSATQADSLGRPETVTVIDPLEVVKGRRRGRLVIHQTGGVLPNGRFLQLWGRPEYRAGSEVVVFAIARRLGDFETAEMLLGKFEVWQDGSAHRFAIPDSALAAHRGVTFYKSLADLLAGRASGSPDASPRELTRFLQGLRRGTASRISPAPSGALTPVRHPQDAGRSPSWGNINNALWRWNNNARGRC
jgi:hypothetical protein